MEKDIDRISKNQDTDVVVRIDDFGGKVGLTIREFVKSDRYTGFTKAGTRIPADKFKQFKDAINSIDENDLIQEASSGEEEVMSEPEKFSSKKEAKPSKQEEIEDFDDAAM